MKENDFRVPHQAKHESGLRRMMANASGVQFLAYESLADAKLANDAAVILEGDDGGQIYLTCPVSLVKCDETALGKLLAELDALAWNDPSTARMYFEKAAVDSGIAGGKGGGRVIQGVWIHPRLAELGIVERIKAIIEGRSETRTANS